MTDQRICLDCRENDDRCDCGEARARAARRRANTEAYCDLLDLHRIQYVRSGNDVHVVSASLDAFLRRLVHSMT